MSELIQAAKAAIEKKLEQDDGMDSIELAEAMFLEGVTHRSEKDKMAIEALRAWNTWDQFNHHGSNAGLDESGRLITEARCLTHAWKRKEESA